MCRGLADIGQQRGRDGRMGNQLQILPDQRLTGIAEHAGKRRVDVGQVEVEVILADDDLAAWKRMFH